MSKKPYGAYVPFTPGGSMLSDLASRTENQAWKRLMEAAAHMPYGTKENFIKRGYEVDFIEGWDPEP